MKVFQKICNNDLGRSMVEMLGVLAIIGVLSAGALAGYSKAMFRHRVNQTIDIFSQVLQRFSEFEQKGWGKDIELGDADDFIKYGILPDCQKGEDEIFGTFCKLPIGFLTWDVIDGSDVGLKGWFDVHFTDSKSCIAFSSVDWKNAVPQEWFIPCNGCYGGYLRVGSKIIYHPFNTGGEAKTKVEMKDIIDGCKQCENDLNNCVFSLEIREDF